MGQPVEAHSSDGVKSLKWGAYRLPENGVRDREDGECKTKVRKQTMLVTSGLPYKPNSQITWINHFPCP